MSSPQTLSSSPGNESVSGSRSKFTYKQLAHLAASSTTCPLRVIAHIDLDAFYAQCEMVRLGVPEDQPLAVQQWQGLIAINYPARASGLTRHVNVAEAKKLCPSLICQHVATWREGDEKWAYHDNAFANIRTHKVSLDPYRLECRKILKCIKGTLPEGRQRVEKASIDEVFLDLSAQIHDILLERYPELRDEPPNGEVNALLPMPPTTALDWQADALVDLDTNETEEDDPDWDDVAILIGSEIVRKVRAAIREQLKYTCSAGIAQNKMVAKLGSAYKKPNQQTVVRNRAIQQFLSDFKFTKIRSFGGKLGDEIVAAFGTDLVKELLDQPLAVLRQKLGDDTGTRVYQLIRGIDHSEVNPRTVLKSMLSAKSFRPTINTEDQAVRWLRIFVADIYSRLVEEGVLENKRRPKTIHLHYRCSGLDRSKSASIPTAGKLTKEILLELAEKLLMMGIVEANIWPCANLSLSVSGFEEGITGNMGIGGFLVKGKEENQKLKDAAVEKHRADHEDSPRPAKRQRTGTSANSIGRFFTLRQESTGAESEGSNNIESSTARREISMEGAKSETSGNTIGRFFTPRNASTAADSQGPHRIGSPRTEPESRQKPEEHAPRTIDFFSHVKRPAESSPAAPSASEREERDEPVEEKSEQRVERAFMCPQCDEGFDSEVELLSHADWHFAKSLQEEDAAARRAAPVAVRQNSNGSGSGNGSKSSKGGLMSRKSKKGGGSDKSGKTQSRLTFG